MSSIHTGVHMEKRFVFAFALAMTVALIGSSASYAALGVPGDYQDGLLGENVPGGDWTPELAPSMTETPASSGIYQLGVSSLQGPGRYQFKILDDGGTPPFTWADTQLTPKNSWFLVSAAGSATISIDTNTYADGFLPTTNRVTSSTDSTLAPGFFATGNWMNEAGGAGDWNPGDALFQMSLVSGGLYSKTVTISTPGAYEFKATKGDWDGQWGADGRNVDASTIAFNVVEPNQEVTFSLDITKGAIKFETETFILGDTDNDTFVELSDLDPIRDNFLTNTFVRSEGDLTGDGVVDVADFHQWKAAYLALSVAASTSVPEPGTLALLALGCLTICGRRSRRGA